MSKDIKIVNPTSEPLNFQLFIGYDFEKSFLGRSGSSKAWSDQHAFKDKMLAQIVIFMKGVSLDHIE